MNAMFAGPPQPGETLRRRHRPKMHELNLVLHTAVSYVHGQGAGIGMVLQARCPWTGVRNDMVPSQEYIQSIRKAGLTAKHITTPHTCQLLALSRALEIICEEFAQEPKLQQKAIICSDSPWVVKTIKAQLEAAPRSLLDIVKRNDRYSTVPAAHAGPA